jgi:Major capsid protein N-terminus/Large eukaryotic DNA virus major capsid protein
MSGGIVQLVAVGAQDAYLSGKPEVSFYRSSYKRYTHFANSVERQLIQGSPSAGGISTIRFEKKGDLLSYVYLSARDSNGALVPGIDWASNVIDKVELLIGGQVIDTQDAYFSTRVEPVVGGQNLNQRFLPLATSTQPGYNASPFYVLKFFFCKDWQSALPLVALQYHDIELRITWSANLGTPATNVAPSGAYSGLQYIVWSNFIYLDQAEREFFAKTPQDMLITQVQRQFVPQTASVMELAFANPVKYLAFQSNNYTAVYNTGGATAGSASASLLQFKTQVNGVDIGESRHLPAWVDAAQYYHTPVGYMPSGSTANVAIVPFCLDTSKLQPTGTVNFSRIDTYRIITPPTVTMSNIVRNAETTIGGAVLTSLYVYAVNYNILRIQNGMGAVLYSS